MNIGEIRVVLLKGGQFRVRIAWGGVHAEGRGTSISRAYDDARSKLMAKPPFVVSQEASK